MNSNISTSRAKLNNINRSMRQDFNKILQDFVLSNKDITIQILSLEIYYKYSKDVFNNIVTNPENVFWAGYEKNEKFVKILEEIKQWLNESSLQKKLIKDEINERRLEKIEWIENQIKILQAKKNKIWQKTDWIPQSLRLIDWEDEIELVDNKIDQWVEEDEPLQKIDPVEEIPSIDKQTNEWDVVSETLQIIDWEDEDWSTDQWIEKKEDSLLTIDTGNKIAPIDKQANELSMTPIIWEWVVSIFETTWREMDILPNLTLPVFDSVYDLESAGKNIPANIQTILNELETQIPLIWFKALNIDEISEIKNYVDTLSDLSNYEIWCKLCEFASVILRRTSEFYDELTDELKSKAKRVDNIINKKGKTTNFQKQTLEIITKWALIACTKIITNNIEPDIIDPTWTLRRINIKNIDISPINVLVLREINDKINVKRQVRLVKSFSQPYKELLQFHAELIIKLSNNWYILSDIFWIDQANILSDHISHIWSVDAYITRMWIITPAQQQLSPSRFYEYKSTIQTMIDNDSQFNMIVQDKCERNIKSVLQTRQEIHIILNDYQQWKKAYEIAKHWSTKRFHVINKIIAWINKIDPIHIDSTDSLIMYPDWENAIQNYFDADSQWRKDIKKIALTYINFPKYEKDVYNSFFEILDKYI